MHMQICNKTAHGERGGIKRLADKALKAHLKSNPSNGLVALVFVALMLRNGAKLEVREEMSPTHTKGCWEDD